jgi:hypothetical protein
VLGATGHPGQALGVPQQAALGRELGFFVGPGGEVIDLFELEAQEIFALPAVTVAGHQLLHAGVSIREAAVCFGDGVAVGLEPREGVQVPEVRPRVYERVVLVLRRDVRQAAGDLRQLPGRGHLPVDEGARAAVGLDDPADDQLGLVGLHLDAGLQHARARRGVGRDVEEGLHLGLFGPGAHHVRAGLATQHQLERADQDGLSGARLPGEDVQAGPELDLELVDDGEIPNTHAREHGGEVARGCDEGRAPP